MVSVTSRGIQINIEVDARRREWKRMQQRMSAFLPQATEACVLSLNVLLHNGGKNVLLHNGGKNDLLHNGGKNVL